MTMSLLVEVGEVLHPAGLVVLGDCLDCTRPDWLGSATRDIVELSYIHPTGTTRQSLNIEFTKLEINLHCVVL